MIASSDVKVKSIILNRTRCGVSGNDTISVEKRSLKSCTTSQQIRYPAILTFLVEMDRRLRTQAAATSGSR